MTISFSPAFALAFALALVRASAWVVICPPFANKSIPSMAKIGVSLGIAVQAAVTLQHDTLPSSDSQIIAQLLVQAAVGFVLGFVVSLFVSAVVAAGSLIDLFSGLNLPQALDPLSLQQTPIIGQFYNLVGTALLFTTGAFLVIVDGFLRSFKAVGTTLPHVTFGSVANVITGDVTTFFAAAVEIAAPVIVVLFATQILLALLAKAAPQINVFVFGFPLQILVALLAVGLALIALPGDVTNLVGRAMTQIFGA
jgi:flagellar biosynthesis protein FliR